MSGANAGHRDENQGDGVAEDVEHAAERLYVTAYRRLVGQLYGVCGDLAEAEDVVQEAFVRAVQHGARFDRMDNHEGWLRTVAVNLARSRHRRRRLGDRLHRRSLAATTTGPDHAEATEGRDRLVAALRRLPSAQREAIALHYLADLPLHEVAQTVGSPVGTVKARLSRARTALAVLLAEDEAHAQPRTEARHG